MIEYRAQRHINETKEELQIRTAIDFDQWRELDHLQAGFFLSRMAEHIWHNGHVVGYICANGHCDGFTFVVRRK